MMEECKKVARLSPITWQHISLISKYEFTKNLSHMIEQLIDNLSKMVVVTNITKLGLKT